MYSRNAALVLCLALGAAAPVTLAQQQETAITWWGCMSVEVNLGSVNLVFDPYVKPNEPRFHYIFSSHMDEDHGHEPTLRALTRPGSPFTLLFASRASFYASRFEGADLGGDTLPADLSFVPPGKALAMYPKYNDTVNSHLDRNPVWNGPVEVVTGRIRVEALRSGEFPVLLEYYRKRYADLGGEFPNLGFLVTDLKTGRTFMHVGDLWNAYPEMEKLRGKVDVLFYPLGKMALAEKKMMMDYVRPKLAVPTHYRLPEPDFPIPPLYLQSMTEAEALKPENTVKASRGYWYPTPADPPAEIAAQREAFKGLTRVVELKAGTRYVLPANLDEFQGRTDKP